MDNVRRWNKCDRLRSFNDVDEHLLSGYLPFVANLDMFLATYAL